MTNYLLIDFGSTYTKLTAVDLENEEILGTSKAKTTSDTSIIEGFLLAKDHLIKDNHLENIQFNHHLACSSAKGGFKMVTIGLSPSLTTEAAKRVALGAGTRILKVFSYGLKEKDIHEINSLSPDIILICGGTNGGNCSGILADVKQLTTLSKSFPIVVAGNEETYPKIEELLNKSHHPYYLTENVMPKVNVLNPNPTREILRCIFMKKIVEAKGMSLAEEKIGKIFMPTPTAVLKAAELLSKGSENEKGLGDLLVVDVGGATTDLYSIGDGKPYNGDIQMEGLQEPFVKRTVEGDLGMRYSASSLLEATSIEEFLTYLPIPEIDIHKKCAYLTNLPDFISTSETDIAFDETLAKIAINNAFKRHAGHYRKEQTPSQVLLYQTGKDLENFKIIIGTGGILVHSKKTKDIMATCLRAEDSPFLTPTDPQFILDTSYILPAIGLLSEDFPDSALRILKKYLTPL